MLDEALAPAGWLAEPAVALCAWPSCRCSSWRALKSYPEAWFILALGIASRLVPLARAASRPTLRRRLVLSFPALLGLVMILAGSVFGGDWLKQRREAGRPLPPADSPNVLLIVLDTVRADRLEPLRISSSHDADARAVGQTGHSLRRGARDRTLDAHVARQLLHRPLAP